MNHIAGVGSEDIINGFRAARAIGKGEDAWMRFLSKLDPAERELYQKAWRMTEASGRGVSDDLASVALRGKISEKIINNKATQFISRKNDFVETGSSPLLLCRLYRRVARSCLPILRPNEGMVLSNSQRRCNTFNASFSSGISSVGSKSSACFRLPISILANSINLNTLY
jgi:hypothetical protein